MKRPEPMSERTFTSAELALNQAAIVREAAVAVDSCLKHPDYTRERKEGGTTVIPLTVDVTEILETLRHIPTDQPALDRHDAGLREEIITEGPQELFARGWLPPHLVAECVREAVREERESLYREIMELQSEPLGRLGMVQALKANRAAASPVSEQAGAPEHRKEQP